MLFLLSKINLFLFWLKLNGFILFTLNEYKIENGLPFINLYNRIYSQRMLN